MRHDTKIRRGGMRLTAVAVAMTAMALVFSGLAPAVSAPWDVKEAESRIGFAGTHAGRPFEGTFKSWSADVRFDPDDLENSRAEVVVNLVSAETGDTTYDKTLPTSDWFQISKFAEGRFVAASFAKGEADNAYRAEGTLSLRGIEVPVTLDFTFDPAGEQAKLAGRTKLKRMDFNIGKDSDASGAWVSLDIPVTVDAVLVPAQDASAPQPKS